MASKTFKVRTLPQCCFVGQGTPFPPWENSFLSHKWSDGCWEPWASRCWHLKTRYPPVLSPEVHRKDNSQLWQRGAVPCQGTTMGHRSHPHYWAADGQNPCACPAGMLHRRDPSSVTARAPGESSWTERGEQRFSCPENMFAFVHLAAKNAPVTWERLGMQPRNFVCKQNCVSGDYWPEL